MDVNLVEDRGESVQDMEWGRRVRELFPHQIFTSCRSEFTRTPFQAKKSLFSADGPPKWTPLVDPTKPSSGSATASPSELRPNLLL